MAKTKDTSTKDNAKKTKSKGYFRAIECSIIMLFFGVAAILLSAFFFSKELVNNPALEPANTYCFFIGMGLCTVAVIVFIFAISSANKQRAKRKSQPISGGVELDSSKVTYIPSQEAPTFIEMGGRQTIEEKFNQIAKMDKTQFVIYVARLFSRKGYQVKLTPVFDNFGIDMLVEKMGTIVAVSCVLTNKILGATDIQPVLEGQTHYPVSNAMVLTNMYFDRSALEFAKSNKISLVDRVILTEDFMN
ncbi:MAG: restriction endonuclease [Clostridia bacterium]|nr:restriction endonuclease [Clostridia bacterium]MBR1955669.1 restriction endonuclease [Clostridia bacterium]MBR2985862.1 restriction endonuclease [Clostridia bacterium]